MLREFIVNILKLILQSGFGKPIFREPLAMESRPEGVVCLQKGWN